ncbi:hypothetical protein C6497_13875 [Candidatus Poribacteria bacterium]|nr:MAG: hypothetical protein C6497_13875 [Candidatus Poribacteria bacterium]
MNIFSKRTLKKDKKSLALEYDNFSPELKAQIIFIFQDVFALKVRRTMLSYGQDPDDDYWEHILQKIERKICEEYGRFKLFYFDSRIHYSNTDISDIYDKIFIYLNDFATTNEILDFIECVFNFKIFTEKHTTTWKHVREDRPDEISYNWDIDNLSLDEHITKLNDRFKEHNIGYRLESNQIIRIDSEYSYSKITEPALQLISDPDYKSVNDEFLEAHKHYKKGESEEALADCRKAIESCLKIICEKRNWSFNTEKDTFIKLLNLVIDKGLISMVHKSGFGGLRAVLESTTGLCNNKKAVHGKGTDDEIKIHDYEAEYVLNITATTLLLLIKAEQNFK